MKSRIMDEMRGTAQDLFAAGFIDKRRMDEHEALFRAHQVPQYTAETVKGLRQRLNISQSVLAAIINTSAATVRAWEAGGKKPGGPSCKLLDLLERKGVEALL
ncbi:MAG: helix-turn-helix domain-containing protein [Deltaproteobacteria bacterium]|nr:helix-turn-helix domain-containing protein [Deltaproteobacteria bacterium]